MAVKYVDVWSYNISVEKIKSYEYSFALLLTPTTLYNSGQAGESTAILSLHPMRAPSNPIQNFPDKYSHKRGLYKRTKPSICAISGFRNATKINK